MKLLCTSCKFWNTEDFVCECERSKYFNSKKPSVSSFCSQWRWSGKPIAPN